MRSNKKKGPGLVVGHADIHAYAMGLFVVGPAKNLSESISAFDKDNLRNLAIFLKPGPHSELLLPPSSLFSSLFPGF